MKLFICGWRPWSVAGRYKSLMLNAKRLGHEVMGVASRDNDRQELTMNMFEQLGIHAGIGPEPGKYTGIYLDDFWPDAIFGEQYWNCVEEVVAKEWARFNGKKHLVLDHNKNYHSVGGPILERQWRAQQTTTIMAATETAAEILTRETRARVVVVGLPQYDLITGQEFDVKATRKKLGMQEGQKLIAVGIGAKYLTDGQPVEGEEEWLPLLLDHAEEHDWKVVCSPHPEERVRKDQLACDAWPRLAGVRRGRYLRSIQDRGVQFVSDFVPGVADGVRFEQVPLYELLAAADGITGSSETLIYPCYVLSKLYFPFNLLKGVGGGMPNVGRIETGFKQFSQAVEQGSGCEQDEETTREFFYKLDGLCWERMLREAGGGD